jgi:hypothetical protein
MPDESKTIEELENDSWPNPDPNDTGLVKTCYALREKPLRDFTPNDMRVMIGQGNNLPLLIPKAITILEPDPLIEADTYYPGLLLETVLRLPNTRAFWDQNPVWVKRAATIAKGALETLAQLKPNEMQWDDEYFMTNETQDTLTNTIRQFINHYNPE